MVDKFIPGLTYDQDDQVTNVGLYTHMTAASFTGLDRTNIATASYSAVSIRDTQPIAGGAPTPSSKALDLWAHSDQRTYPQSVKGGALPSMLGFVAQNAVAAGHILEPTGTMYGAVPEMKKATSSYKAFAVALQDVAAGASGSYAAFGVAKVKFNVDAPAGGRNFRLDDDGLAELITNNDATNDMIGRTLGVGSGGMAWCMLYR